MWEINVTNQVFTFLWSMCLGGLLCAIYDILRAMRKAGFDSFAAVFFTDIIFWVLSAFLTFIFLISRTNGEIRGYVLAGMLGGFGLFRISISRLLFPAISFLFINILKIKRLISKFINQFYTRFEALILKIWNSMLKFLKSAKKLLKIGHKLLYTNKNIANTENALNETKTKA